MSKHENTDEYRLWISYKESSTGGEKIDLGGWWSNHFYEIFNFFLSCFSLKHKRHPTNTDINIDVTFYNCYRICPNNFGCDSVVVSKEIYQAEKVYVLVVRYSDGYTFGRSNGNWTIEGAYSDLNKYQEVVSGIENKTYKSSEGYNVWEGYFARLENIEVHEFTVEEKPIDINSGEYTSLLHVIKH